MKILDQLLTYLRERNGVTDVALAYLIRNDDEGAAALPALNDDFPWSGEHSNFMEELIAYSPLTGAAYVQDNAALYSIL
jgi:hypothetical protein